MLTKWTLVPIFITIKVVNTKVKPATVLDMITLKIAIDHQVKLITLGFFSKRPLKALG